MDRFMAFLVWLMWITLALIAYLLVSAGLGDFSGCTR